MKYLLLLLSIGILVGCASTQKTIEVITVTPVHIQPPTIKDTLKAPSSPVVAIAPIDSISGKDSALIVPDRPISAVKTDSTGDTVATATVNLRKGTVAITVRPAPIDTTITHDTTVTVTPVVIHKLTFWQRIKTLFVDWLWLIVVAMVVYVIIKTGIWKQISVIAKLVSAITKFLPF